MDQAKTLRQMLGAARPLVTPIFGDLQAGYAVCVARLVLEQHAQHQNTALLFDGSAHGVSALFDGLGHPQDLMAFFRGRKNLEDLVVRLADRQYWVAAQEGLSGLSKKPQQVDALLGNFHRLPVSCDYFYTTLPYGAWKLAGYLAPASEWFWVVQPTAHSVTQVFQGIRHSSGVDENCQHRVIVAGVKNTDEADHVFSNLLDTTMRFLVKPLQYAGHLPVLAAGKPLNQISRDMIQAGRRVAKLICSLEEHAFAP
jgi:MinD-like ATPase involved in chromosome partitioning or flagellar assembly